jgi:glyoxylase-like metal-dependent hydrolase (beta-lactamase superfamily II)
LREFGVDEERIAKALILHAHFDHVGIVPFLKRRNSKLTIYASGRAWQILHTPKAIDTINEFSHRVAARMGRKEVYARGYDLDWRDDIEGATVSEGDCIDLGDLSVHIYDTPGHSSCSVSAYVPQFKALFASDGGGIPFKETIIASGNSNYTLFQKSLEKLKDLDVEYVCADHYGYVTGDEARNFISRSIQIAGEHRTSMEEVYLRVGNIEGAAQELSNAIFEENPEYIIAPQILEGVYRQMLRHIVTELMGDDRK